MSKRVWLEDVRNEWQKQIDPIMADLVVKGMPPYEAQQKAVEIMGSRGMKKSDYKFRG